MGCCCPCCWVANSSFVTLWTVAYQPLSMHGISPTRILEWVAFPSPGYLPDPGIEPVSPALASGFFTHWATGKPSLTWGMHTELEIISISKLSISILYYENIASLWLLCHSTWTKFWTLVDITMRITIKMHLCIIFWMCLFHPGHWGQKYGLGASLGGSVVKNPPVYSGSNTGSIPGLGRSHIRPSS